MHPDQTACGPPGVQWEAAACVLCRSERHHIVRVAADRLFGLPGRFRLVRCSECGHFYLNPRPTRETIGRFYPDDYGPHRNHQSATEQLEGGTAHPSRSRPWYLSSPMRRFPGLRPFYCWLSETHSEIIPSLAGDRPRGLELGCGSGRFLERLVAAGWDAVGIEPAEAPARRCRERGLNVHIGDLTSAKLDDASFDAVFAWMVIEHLHDPLAAILRVRRLLKPQGRLLLSVPNYDCWESLVFGEHSYSLQLPIHLHQFTPNSLQRLLHQGGFRVEQIIHQPNLLNVVGSIGLWLESRFPDLSWGPRLVQFTNAPTMWWSLALALPAKLLAAVRQGGRLTVIASPDERHGA